MRSSIERLADDAPGEHGAPAPLVKPRSPSPAYEAALRALKEEAEATIRASIKMRARAYGLRPRELNAIRPGLSTLPAWRLVEALSRLKFAPDWRWFGFGGEHPAINVRGAILYARHARAAHRGKI